MDWNLMTILGVLGALVGLAAFLKFVKLGSKWQTKAAVLLIGGLAIAGIGQGIIGNPLSSLSNPLTAAGTTGSSAQGSQTLLINDNTGDAATVAARFYSASDGSSDEVYPTIYALSATDGTLLSVSSGNITTNQGDTIDVYGAGASYYCDAITGFSVNRANPLAENTKCRDVASAESFAITAFDDTNAALTADDDAENTADYTLGNLGAGETKQISVKFRNAQADKDYDLGLIAAFWMNDVSKLEIVDSRFEQVTCPKQLTDSVPAVRNDSNDSLTGSWKTCYKPKDNVLHLKEWDSLILPVVVTAGSTAPSANTGDNAGLLFADISYVKGADNKIYYDFHDHTQDQKISGVGISELSNLTDPTGLKMAVAFEAQ